jgi:4-hydroxybenzoate polyprenyltransferase
MNTPRTGFATYLKIGRVSNLPTVWTNVLAGAFLSGHAADVTTLLWVMLAITLFYTGGMYLNDAFDADIDARERPNRPIPSGQISA